jgi:hypothetical protein
MGVFPFYSSSEVLALELLSRGTLFDSVLIEVPPGTESSPPLLTQLRARHPSVPVFIVSRRASEHYVLERDSNPACRVEDSDVTTLAQTILAAIAHEAADPGCTSGVLPVSGRVPAERLILDGMEIIG